MTIGHSIVTRRINWQVWDMWGPRVKKKRTIVFPLHWGRRSQESQGSRVGSLQGTFQRQRNSQKSHRREEKNQRPGVRISPHKVKPQRKGKLRCLRGKIRQKGGKGERVTQTPGLGKITTRHEKTIRWRGEKGKRTATGWICGLRSTA